MKTRSKPTLFLSLLFFSGSVIVFDACAQGADNSQAMERMDRMEHDVMLLQRQVSRGGSTSGTTAVDSDLPPGSAAQIEVRLSTIEDQLRELRGKNEENENQVHKLSDTLTKMQHDTDFRFNELAHSAAAAPAQATPASSPAPTFPAKSALPPQDKTSDKAGDKSSDKNPDKSGQTTAGDGVLHAPKNDSGDGKGESNNFTTPRDHYNYAFRLLNQTQYEEAATAFESFTKKYPKDPLVGNAFYWEGETYYIRRDYVNAADNFRQGFEALPEGPKAADNLLKLAMSLNALNRDKEACLVLQQITTKFKKSASSVSDKSDQEQKRIGCHAKS